MLFTVFRDRLIIEAVTPSEGFWLHGVMEEITGFGFDCRNDVQTNHCKIQVPLRKQGELSDFDKTLLAAQEEIA